MCYRIWCYILTRFCLLNIKSDFFIHGVSIYQISDGNSLPTVKMIFIAILWIKYLTLCGIWTHLWYFCPFCVRLPIRNHWKTLLTDLTGFIELIPMPKFHKRGFYSLNLTKMKKCILLLQIYPFLCLIIVISCKLMKSSSIKVEWRIMYIEILQKSY